MNWRIALVLLPVVGTAAAAVLARRAFRRVRGAYAVVNGARLHYTDDGMGDPVILLHGFAVNADLNWRLPGLTRLLSREFRVVAPDLRGHGLSDKPREPNRYGLELVEDVVRLMDHLGIQRAHVVGYSLGGIVTLKLAAAHPERLITACPLGAGWERAQESAFLAAIGEMADALESGRGIGPVAGRLGGQRERPGLLHTLWVLFLTRYLNDGKALAALVRAMPQLALTEEEVSQIRVPMCSIVGSRDPLRPGAEALKERLPQVELTLVQGADHLRALVRKELHGALLSFLRRHSI